MNKRNGMISGHLFKNKYRGSGCSNKAITHLTFSPDGDELLANIGGEQIYLFDIIGGQQPVVSKPYT